MKDAGEMACTVRPASLKRFSTKASDRRVILRTLVSIEAFTAACGSDERLLLSRGYRGARVRLCAKPTAVRTRDLDAQEARRVKQLRRR